MFILMALICIIGAVFFGALTISVSEDISLNGGIFILCLALTIFCIISAFMFWKLETMQQDIQELKEKLNKGDSSEKADEGTSDDTPAQEIETEKHGEEAPTDSPKNEETMKKDGE